MDLYEKVNELIEHERELIIVKYFDREFHNDNGLKILKEKAYNFIYGWLVCYFDYVLKSQEHYDFDLKSMCSYVHDKIYEYDYETAGANFYE